MISIIATWIIAYIVVGACFSFYVGDNGDKFWNYVILTLIWPIPIATFCGACILVLIYYVYIEIKRIINNLK